MRYNSVCLNAVWLRRFCFAKSQAEVAELADALRSGRSGLYARVGSTPTFGTILRGGAEAARQAHNLEVRGSNPLPATL